MKKALFVLLAFATPLLYGDEEVAVEKSSTHFVPGRLDTPGLKALLDSGSSLVLLDARGDKWNENAIIPGAQLAWHEDKNFDALIPTKDTLVVVYCFSYTCPYAGKLVKKLHKLGYTNLVEYPPGLKEWRDIAGYPVDKIQ